EDTVYGILPYIAPEVLHGKPYTKADIYSIRPKIIEGTMSKYVELMKRCWDNNLQKRPTANTLKKIYYKWNEEYLFEEIKKREYLFRVINII
ncbi:hypothetical protein C1645_761152, partial [Glomus cerebriforme]